MSALREIVLALETGREYYYMGLPTPQRGPFLFPPQPVGLQGGGFDSTLQITASDLTPMLYADDFE